MWRIRSTTTASDSTNGLSNPTWRTTSQRGIAAHSGVACSSRIRTSTSGPAASSTTGSICLRSADLAALADNDDVQVVHQPTRARAQASAGEVDEQAPAAGVARIIRKPRHSSTGGRRCARSSMTSTMAWSVRMLEPDGRAALTEQLRPPSGFQLAHAVATTFTLDLTTALSVPLAFAAHRVRESQRPDRDPRRRATRRRQDRCLRSGRPGLRAAGRLRPVRPSRTDDPSRASAPSEHAVPSEGLGARVRRRRRAKLPNALRQPQSHQRPQLGPRRAARRHRQPTNQPSRARRSAPSCARCPRCPCSRSRTDRVGANRGTRRMQWPRSSGNVQAMCESLRFHPYGIPGVTPEPLHELFDGMRHGIISPFLSDEGIRRIIPPRSELDRRPCAPGATRPARQPHARAHRSPDSRRRRQRR